MMKSGRNFMIGAAVMAVSVLTPLTSFAAGSASIVPGCGFGTGTNSGIVTVIGGNKANCPGGAGNNCGGKDCGINGKVCSGKDNCTKPGCSDKNNSCGSGSCTNAGVINNIASLLGQGSSCSR